MEEYNHSQRSMIHGVHTAQGKARRRASSDARSISRPLYSAMGTGPVRPRATFFEDSTNSRIYGSSFNHARDHYHTNGNISVINFFDTSPAGIKDALEILRFDKPPPARLSRSNPTSEINSPKLLPRSINDSDNGGLFEETPTTNPNYYQPHGNGQNPIKPPTTVGVNEKVEAYYRQLLIKQRGFPLYVPEPGDTLPLKYQRRGVGIGDVGIFTDYGAFEYLFNVCIPKDDPINPISILHNFHPLNPPAPEDIEEDSVFGSNDYLASYAMKIGSSSDPMTFLSTASEGAVLVLPNGSKSYDLGATNLTAFMKYASANVEKWYKYAKETFGYPAKNGDLRLVVGHDTATSWGLMSFTNLHDLEAFCFRFKEISKDQFTKCYHWEYLDNRRAEARSGPDIVHGIETSKGSDQKDVSGALENQCLFARTLNISFRQEDWGRLVAERIGGLDSTDSLQSFEEHPSKTINDLLLKARPNARIAITQDWNWISAIQATDNALPSQEVLFARILEMYDICEDEDTVFLEAKPINKVMGPRNMPRQRLSDGYTSEVEINEETNRCEDMRTKEYAKKRNDEEMRWAEEEVRRVEEAMRKEREAIGKEQEAIRKEREGLEQEMLSKAEEFRKKEQVIKTREMEAERKLEAAKKMEVQAREKAEEVKTKESDLKKKDEETSKREEQIKKETETIRRLHIEAKTATEEAKGKQKQLPAMETFNNSFLDSERLQRKTAHLMSGNASRGRIEVRRLEEKVACIAAKHCSVEEITSLYKELEEWLFTEKGDQTSSLLLSAALLRAILMNHLAHSDASMAAQALEANLKNKIEELEEQISKIDAEVRRQRSQYTQKSQECQQLRLEIQQVRALATTVPKDSAPETPIPESRPPSPAPYSLGGLSYKSTPMVPPRPRRLSVPSPPKMMSRSTREEKADTHERWLPTMQHDDNNVNLPRHSDATAAMEKERQKLMYASTTARSASVRPPSRMGSLMSSFRR